MDANPTAATATTALTYSDFVFDHLRADIVQGVFAPASKLAMKDLTARYQVGLSPIREALHRLVGEGFVLSVGQRGFTVPPLTLEDLEDLTALRTLVEEAAIRQAIARGGDTWEAGIVAAFHRLEKQAARFATDDETAIRHYDAVHRGFHTALYAGVTAPRLATLHGNLYDQAFRYRKTLHHKRLTARDIVAEHRRLMKVVLSRDADAAAAALCGHLQLTRKAAASFLADHAG
ncbi:MAG TPA: FCD domain-containing protein [Ramlibacter sp.]|nr:FCD domain-containing protein [Ramlibacter sp.]